MNIDIHSPLFDILINEDFYKNIFTIIIPIGNIKTNKIANNYINTFNKLNQDKTKYLSLFVNYKSDEDIEFLSKLNINFNVIKKLIIYNYNNDIYDRDEFLNFILSFQFNSLVYLEIKAKLIQFITGKETFFEKINKIKSLRYFKLLNTSKELDCSFEPMKITINLFKLKEFAISMVNYCILHEGIFLNLNTLYLKKAHIMIENCLSLKLPYLEKLTYLGIINHDFKKEDELIIDLKSCDKLKYFRDIKDFFFDIKDKPLEIIKLYDV